MRYPYAITAACITAVLVGCESNKKGVPAGKPSQPPPFPRPVEMPIDARLQADAKKEILAELHSPDELMRAHALETMKDLKLPETDAAALAGLRDSSVLVRKAAAYVVGELQLKDAELILPELLNTPEAGANPVAVEQERIATIFAMHRLGNTQFSHELEKTAADSRSHVRAETAFVLGLLGDRSAVPILLQMTYKDTDGNVRLEAGEALWRLGDDRGEDALLAATISAYASDQMIGLLGLAERHDVRVLGHIEGCLNSEYPEVALVATRAAGILGSMDGYGVAIKGAASVDPRQLALSAMAFGAIGRSDAQPRLAKLLKDEDPDVRLAAAGALIQLKK